MINQEQLIQNPFGINVFGSSLIRVEPDIASLNFAVSRTQKHPKDAFKEAREASQSVRRYLEQAKLMKSTHQELAFLKHINIFLANKSF
jgi:uncharacterized protein YggE